MKDALRTPTRTIDPNLGQLLRTLRPGDRIRITSRVRVGSRVWNPVVTGTFRTLDYLRTGVTTERVPEDDLIVPMIHFTKDNGELSSSSIDESTKVERLP